MNLTSQLLNDFGAWADEALGAAPPNATAFNFNIYEALTTWDVELIGTSEFDESDSDWACDPIFSYPEMFFVFRDSLGHDREDALAVLVELVVTYLRSGSRRDVLRESQGVGVGFVDGDLTIVWPDRAA